LKVVVSIEDYDGNVSSINISKPVLFYLIHTQIIILNFEISIIQFIVRHCYGLNKVLILMGQKVKT
jgi:hypothetical protein